MTAFPLLTAADGPAWIWAPVLGVLGAIFGSFIAVLVVRWPQGRSVAGGRSACDACGRPLGAAELIPVLSAVLLRGRCRGCGASIDPVHMLTELVAVAVGAIAGFFTPGLPGVAGAVFGWLLLALAMLDLRAFWLPDRLTLALGIGGLAVGGVGIGPPLPDRLIGGVAGFGMLWAVAVAYRALRGREGLGGGDPKMMGAIGLWVGWQLLPVVLLLACLVGLGVVLFHLATARPVEAADHLPLGTLLAVAAYPVWIALLASG